MSRKENEASFEVQIRWLRIVSFVQFRLRTGHESGIAVVKSDDSEKPTGEPMPRNFENDQDGGIRGINEVFISRFWLR